jgi:glycine cleavage system H protein
MSILFVLLTFIVIVTFNYLHSRGVPETMAVSPEMPLRPKLPVMAKEFGFSIPQGYSFHPGHAWVVREGRGNARVGLDSFASDLIGKIDQVEVANVGRWVRQGQRLMTVHASGLSLDVLSPVEGVVMAMNTDVAKDPALITRDPYNNGWIAVLESPDFSINQKNLLQGSMVAPWMHYNVARLNTAIAQSNPEFAQDGGVPLSQVLTRVSAELRQKLIKDFFLN